LENGFRRRILAVYPQRYHPVSAFDTIFSSKDIRIYKEDKEFMTTQLRMLRCKKSREYSKKQEIKQVPVASTTV
jgi:hypothetical protein